MCCRNAKPLWPGSPPRGSRDSVTWLGHASFLIRLGGRTILTDPFLTERASPLPWFGPRRIAGPGLPPELLPPLDLLLLSHNHYDHLDLRALARAAGSWNATSVIMPLRLSRYLDTGSFAQAIELDWLQQAEIAGIRITALPAIHFSKRGLFDRNASLWCGFLLEAAGRTHPVHRRYRLRPGVRRDRGARGTARPRAGADRRLRAAPADGRARTARRRKACGSAASSARGGCAACIGARSCSPTSRPFEPPGRFRAAARAHGYAEDDAWVLAIGETKSL